MLGAEAQAKGSRSNFSKCKLNKDGQALSTRFNPAPVLSTGTILLTPVLDGTRRVVALEDSDDALLQLLEGVLRQDVALLLVHILQGRELKHEFQNNLL